MFTIELSIYTVAYEERVRANPVLYIQGNVAEVTTNRLPVQRQTFALNSAVVRKHKSQF